MVPEGWKLQSLEDTVRKKISYGIVQAGPHVPGGIPYIKSSDITDEIDVKNLQRTHPDIHQKYIRSAVYPGDIVFSLRGNTGEVKIIPENLSEANLTQGTARISISDENHNRYFLYQLGSAGVRSRVIAMSKGSTFKEISLTDLRKVKILRAPLPEQKKIAQILFTWDKAIATTEKLLANSQQQKKALMQQLLTGKKRLLDPNVEMKVRDGFARSKLGALPEDWKIDLIGDHLWFQEGPGVRKHQFRERGVKLFNGTNIQFNQIDLGNTETFISCEEANGTYSHFLIDDGDLVIACSGISVDRFDEKIATITSEHLPLCMNTSTMRFKETEDGNVSIDYFRYFMQSPLFKNQIRRQATGSAQLNFGPSHIGKCYVTVPSAEEQRRIADALTIADGEIEAIKLSIAELGKQKKALMQQLLTGKRRVAVDSGHL